MEVVFGFAEYVNSEGFVDFVHSAEEWPAEFHAAFDDTGTVVAHHPFRGIASEALGCLRSGVYQRKFVESEANFRVGSG